MAPKRERTLSTRSVTSVRGPRRFKTRSLSAIHSFMSPPPPVSLCGPGPVPATDGAHTRNGQSAGSTALCHPNRRRLAPVLLAPFLLFLFFCWVRGLERGWEKLKQRNETLLTPRQSSFCGAAGTSEWTEQDERFEEPSHRFVKLVRSTCRREKCPCKALCWLWGNASPAWSSCVSTI